MPKVRTRLGGESSAPSYDFLRDKLHDIFTDQTPGSVNAYEVVRDGALWYVKAGIINDPDARWHEYGIEYRQTEVPGGAWYESEMRDGDGETTLAFAFAQNEGYQTAVYVPNRGTELCFRRASEAHYAGTLAVIQHTMFSEQMSLAAAQRLQQGQPPVNPS
jgi:hypothetical protein